MFHYDLVYMQRILNSFKQWAFMSYYSLYIYDYVMLNILFCISRKDSYLDKFAIATPADSITPLCRHFNSTLTIISIQYLTSASDCIKIPISQAVSHDTYREIM